jgi:NADH-quinone oxidoreductase subunit E
MGEAVIENGREAYNAAGFRGDAEELIPLLQFLQKKDGYISQAGADEIARFLGISAAQVFTVASFYAQFRFHKPGENHVRVCLGTACHVQGGGELSREAQELLLVHSGETTPDGRFDLEEVACLGCCAQAAVVEVNGKIYAKMSRDELRKVLGEHGRA